MTETTPRSLTPKDNDRPNHLDQDICFELHEVPIRMRLDTTQADDTWILTPRVQSDEGIRFHAVMAFIRMVLRSATVNVQVDGTRAILQDPECTGIQQCVLSSLPEWNGRGFAGLMGCGHLANWLMDLSIRLNVPLTRSDGTPIDFQEFAIAVKKRPSPLIPA